MSFGHGKKAVFKLDNGAGTLVDISAYLDDLTSGSKIAADDVTAFGAVAKAFIQGLEEGSFACGGKFSTTLHAQVVAIKAAMRAGTIASVLFEYAPIGTTTGNPKISGTAIMNTYDINSPVANVSNIKMDFTVTGVQTDGTY